MLQVKAFPALVGKTVNLPHSDPSDDNEYGVGGSKVVFDSEGFAIVTETQAAGLEEFYSDSCVVVGSAPQKALKALAKVQADKIKASEARGEEHQAAQAVFKAANAEALAATN